MWSVVLNPYSRNSISASLISTTVELISLCHRNTCTWETVCTAVKRPVLEVSGTLPKTLRAPLEKVGQPPRWCPTGPLQSEFPSGCHHTDKLSFTVQASEHYEQHECWMFNRTKVSVSQRSEHSAHTQSLSRDQLKDSLCAVFCVISTCIFIFSSQPPQGTEKCSCNHLYLYSPSSSRFLPLGFYSYIKPVQLKTA